VLEGDNKKERYAEVGFTIVSKNAFSGLNDGGAPSTDKESRCLIKTCSLQKVLFDEKTTRKQCKETCDNQVGHKERSCTWGREVLKASPTNCSR
jgi:hypothetical protein